MNEDLVAFEDFLNWFVNLHDVSDQQKYHFLEHLNEESGFSEKAIEFVEGIFDKQDKKYANQAEEYKKLAGLFRALALKQESPDLSLKSEIVKHAEDFMMDSAIKFKHTYRVNEKATAKKEETTQTSAEEDEVARLKAMVGA